MKRFFALLLIAFLLCGCSKSYAEILNPGGTSMYDKDATQPTTAPLLPQENYPEGTALVVKFEMGAEFVVLLDSWHAVIDVTAENEAGEALLAGIEPAGSYRNAVETILSEANDQTLLESGTVITLTANGGHRRHLDRCRSQYPDLALGELRKGHRNNDYLPVKRTGPLL